MKPATHDPYDFSDMHDILGPANGFQNHASFSEILIYLYLKLLPHFQVIEMKLLFIIIIITIFIIIIIIVIIIIVVHIIFIVITNITTAPSIA